MGDFGLEHLNANISETGERRLNGGFTDADRRDAPEPIDTATDNARKLKELIILLQPLGGYIYFPPGNYHIGRYPTPPDSRIQPQEFGDIMVPPNVTLWFAPGAVLIPLRDPDVTTLMRPAEVSLAEREAVRIEIQGDIIAEMRQIFATAYQVGSATRDAGIILLAGNRIREAYPEWWGATSTESGVDPGRYIDIPRDNANAIQAAVDAVYHHRTTPRRVDESTLARSIDGAIQWNLRPTIPLVFSGQYAISKEITVGVASDWVDSGDPLRQPPLGGFEFEGEKGNGASGTSWPSLWAFPVSGTSRFDGEALLAVRGPVGFSIRNLSLEGGSRFAPCCLLVKTIDADWRPATIDGCSFLRAACLPEQGGRLLVLDAETMRRPPVSDPVFGGTPPRLIQDFWNVAITRCYFILVQRYEGPEPPGPDDRKATDRELIDTDTGRRLDRENNFVGIELRLGDNQGMELRDCIFSGAASPGIRAFTGRFAMNHTAMHLLRPWSFEGNEAYQVARQPELNPSFAHGCDVIVDAPASSPAWAFITPVLPASFTMRDHQSHSWQVLGTKRLTTVRSRSACILMNVKGIVEATSPERNPPAVHWCGGGPGASGGRLVLIDTLFAGTDVRAPARPGHTPGVVDVGNGVTGDIFNIGPRLFSADTMPLWHSVQRETGDGPIPVVRHLVGQSETR